jgi:hypothetical protein
MTRVTVAATLSFVLALSACQSAQNKPPASNGTGGEGGDGGEGGAGGGAGGSGGAKPMGKDASPDLAGAGGSGGAAGPDAAPADAVLADALMSVDTRSGDASGDASSVATGGVPLAGRAHIRLCGKDWTQAQCCEFLCACLRERCVDAPRAVPGIAGCMNTCMKLDDKTMRCHVYHCYEARGPDFRDHESHCAHAANTLGGGGCPTAVYQ